MNRRMSSLGREPMRFAPISWTADALFWDWWACRATKGGADAAGRSEGLCVQYCYGICFAGQPLEKVSGIWTAVLLYSSSLFTRQQRSELH